MHWATVNSGAILRAMRRALFTWTILSDASLIHIAKEAEPNKTLIDCTAEGFFIPYFLFFLLFPHVCLFVL